MLLSIIIPAFNAEKYVEKCLNKVIPVLEDDIECIIVDDGSTDGTLKILKKIAAKRPNIKIIAQKNTGVSGARNIAMSNAKGMYTCFIDIDDTIDATVFRRVIEYLRNNLHEELVVFPHYEGNVENVFSLKEQSLPEGTNINMAALCQATFSQKLNEPWKKIYRTDILCTYNVKFPTDMYMGEDICMFADYLSFIHSYSYVNLPYYYYNKNEESVSAKIKLSFLEQEAKIYCHLNDIIRNYSLDNKLRVENDRLFLHKITRHIQGLVDQKVSIKAIQNGVVQSGVEDRIKQIKYTKKVDMIRKWLLVNRKYYLLTIILKVFKGK